MERMKKRHGLQRIEERIKIVNALFFFETGTDRASNMKLQRLVRMCLRPYLKRQWMNPSYYFCVSSKEQKRTRTSSTITMYPITQGSVFERTYEAALRLHNLYKVQPLLLQLFVGQLSYFYPPLSCEDVGRRRAQNA